jgi:PAS domain S-box-containing protein
LIKLEQNTAIVRLYWNVEMEATKDICHYNKGVYTFMPLVWGGSPIILKEKHCYFNGDPYCEYHLKWPVKNQFYEIFSRFFSSKSVLMDTIKEMEIDKKIIEEKTEQLENEIEERKRSENTLKESEERYRTLIEVSPDPIFVYDSQGRVTYLNKAFEKTFGWSYKEVKNTYIDFVPSHEMEKTQKAIKHLMNGEPVLLESQRLTKDGRLLHVQVKADLLYDVQGVVEGSIVVSRDITELKKTESKLKKAYYKLKDIQAQLIQSAKLASIGELAAGVAHELNQPLMIMRMDSQLTKRIMKKKKLTTENIIELQDTIERNTKRMMKIIDHLRTFSRQSSGDYELININKIIEEAFLMVNEQLRLRNITPKKDLMKTLPKIFGDAIQMEQVLLNLLTNARDAIEAKIAHSNDTTLVGEIQIITKISSLKKDHIEILIKDNGGGIPELKQNKIFDPFFTTKEVDKGTGIVLSISYGIIKEHGGEIILLKTSLEGTSFVINLPISEVDGNRPIS